MVALVSVKTPLNTVRHEIVAKMGDGPVRRRFQSMAWADGCAVVGVLEELGT